jgi:hypothetical protein
MESSTLGSFISLLDMEALFSQVLKEPGLFMCWYTREIKKGFSFELSQIQFINYFPHIVDLFRITCHDISKLITSLVTRTNTHLPQYYVSCLVVDYCMCLQTLDTWQYFDFRYYN